MKKIILFGGGGFIGYNIIKHLIKKKNIELTIYDIDIDKIKIFADKINIIKGDISDPKENLEELILKNDIIVDLIARANPSLYVEKPLEVFKLNFIENLKILDLCVKFKKRIIQFSTCEVYGQTLNNFTNSTNVIKFNEETTPMIMGPVNKQRWIYASGKSLLERIIYSHGIENNLDYTIIRPFNFIGPEIDYLPDENSNSFKNDIPRVFSIFLNNLIYKKPFVLVNGGNQLRTYTYIDDAIDIINKIILDDKGITKKKIYNIGNPNNETTIKNFANLMIKIFNDKFTDKEFIPELLIESGEHFYGVGYEDCDRRIPCVDKIIKDLDFKPKYNLEDTLYLTIKYFMNK